MDIFKIGTLFPNKMIAVNDSYATIIGKHAKARADLGAGGVTPKPKERGRRANLIKLIEEIERSIPQAFPMSDGRVNVRKGLAQIAREAGITEGTLKVAYLRSITNLTGYSYRFSY